MAFVQLESWRAAPEPSAIASARLIGPLPARWDKSLRRVAASSFTIAVHCCLLWLLINRLADGTVSATREGEAALTVFDVAPPGAAGRERASAVPKKAPDPAAQIPTIVNLSRPADLPTPEWSLSTIKVARVPAPAASGLASAELAPGAAGAAGASGPRLSQFVGFGDSIGGQLMLDKAMLEAARLAVMRAFPQARGTALIFLRVSPSGTVMGAVIRGGSKDVSLALRRELLGKKLFQVRSAISESALVALPPVNLGMDS